MDFYVRKSVESLIRGVKLAKVINTEDVVCKDEFKRSWMCDKEQRWKEKRMYGQFFREMPESVDANETWKLMRKADLNVTN